VGVCSDLGEEGLEFDPILLKRFNFKVTAGDKLMIQQLLYQHHKPAFKLMLSPLSVLL